MTTTSKESLSIWPDRSAGPLTFSQHQIVSDHFRSFAQDTLNLSFAVLLSGEIDKSVLIDSFNDLVERHEPLRTRYSIKNGEFIAAVFNDVKVGLNEIDLTNTSAHAQWERVGSLAREDAAKPFDLGKDDNARISFINIDETTAVMLLSLHHVTADAWAMEIFCREWSILYNLRIRNSNLGDERDKLKPLAAQCIDGAFAQRRWLAGPEATGQMEWWREQTSLIDWRDLDLEFDHPRLPVPYLRTSRRVSEIPQLAEDAIGYLQNECKISTFDVLTSALSIVLFKWLRKNTVVFSSLAANRRLPGLGKCLGSFYNTVHYCHRIDSGWSIWELLENVSRHSLEVLENQTLPFSLVCGLFKNQPEGIWRGLTRIMFFLDRYPAEQLRFDGIQSRGLHFDPQATLIAEASEKMAAGFETHLDRDKPGKILRLLTASNSDISFFVRQGSESKSLSVFYKTDLIADNTAALLIDSFFDVVIQMAENGSGSIADIETGFN